MIIYPGTFEILFEGIFFSDIVVAVQLTCSKALSKTSRSKEYRNTGYGIILKVIKKRVLSI